MQATIAKEELKRQSKINKEPKRRSVKKDADEFIKSNKNGQWVEDTTVKRCMRCEKAFTLTIRRHHCRECGGIFCDGCSSRKLIIGGQLKRACENCYESVVCGKNKSLGPVKFPSGLSGTEGISSQKNFLDSLPDGALSPRPSSITSGTSASRPSQNTQYPWVKSLLLIRSLGRTQNDAPEIDAVYPNVLCDDMLEDIIQIAMPNELNKERESLEFNFTFRIDQNRYSSGKDLENGENSDLLYGFVLYRQKQLYVGKDENRTSRPIRQSLVMLSEVPVPYLAYRFLTNLEEALFHILSISSAMKQEKESSSQEETLTAGSSDRTAVKDEVNRALQVGVNMMSSWPAIELSEDSPSLNLALPMLGEIVQFSVNLPIIVPRSLCSVNEPFDFSKMSLGSSVTYTSGTNLISHFGPYGLVPHLWVLWELLVQGKDFVVLSHFADACSEIVMALSSLVIASSNHYRGGDVYPYISRHNKSEVHRIASEAKKKKMRAEEGEQPSRPDQSLSTIVGITDPSLLQDFRHFSVLVILSPKISEQEGQSGGSSPSHVTRKSVALQKSINTISAMNSSRTPLQKLADESIVKYNPKFASPLKTASDFDTKESTPSKLGKSKVGLFAKGFIHWKRSKDVSGPNAPPAYVVIQAPSSAISFPKKLQERVCSRLSKLSRRDYLVLGDRILRDHFNEMSERIFEPSPDDKLQSPTVATSSSDDEEYEEVEEVVPDATDATEAPGALAKVLIMLKKNHDVVQISTFRNFCGAILGSALLLCNRILHLPPLWLSILLITVFFVPSNDSFEAFVAKQVKSSNAQVQKKVTKKIKRKKESKSKPAGSSTKPDYSGVWKRTRTVNFEAFAGAQGAGYVQRKLAASIDMVVTITMDAPLCSAVRIQEDGGPIHGDNTMIIGGDSSEGALGQKVYMDRAEWEGEGSEAVLKVTKVLHPSKEYELIVRRYLEDNGQSMRQMQVFVGKDGKRVESQAFFTRTGNSPNPPPQSNSQSSEQEATKSGAPPKSEEQEQSTTVTSTDDSTPPAGVDLSGVWSRFKSHNMDQYVGALGAGYMQRKLAGSIAMEHTITMNPPHLNAFRLQEVGGPIKSDNVYTIGAAEPLETKLGKQPYLDKVQWKRSITAGTLLEPMPSSGTTLTTCRTPVGGDDHTLYQGRYLEDPKTLVVVNIHYNHATNVETVATNWFKYTGPSPNAPPEPTLPIMSDGCKDPSDSQDTENTENARQDSRQASTSSLRVDFSGEWERRADDSEKMASTVMTSPGSLMASTTHTISMNPPALSVFEIKETWQNNTSQRKYDIGGDSIETEYNDKQFKEKCYWLGDALVVQKLSQANDFEILVTRYLEDDRIRLVTVRKNLNTGDTTESVSFFTKKSGKSEATRGSEEEEA